MYNADLETPEQILGFFSSCHNFIDQALDEGKHVMVHCLAGAHRAGTTGVSYMMKQGHMSYKNAVSVAKQQRPVVDPIGHLEQLLLRLEWAYTRVKAQSGINVEQEKTETKLEILAKLPDAICFKTAEKTLAFRVPDLNLSSVKVVVLSKGNK